MLLSFCARIDVRGATVSLWPGGAVFARARAGIRSASARAGAQVERWPRRDRWTDIRNRRVSVSYSSNKRNRSSASKRCTPQSARQPRAHCDRPSRARGDLLLNRPVPASLLTTSRRQCTRRSARSTPLARATPLRPRAVARLSHLPRAASRVSAP